MFIWVKYLENIERNYRVEYDGSWNDGYCDHGTQKTPDPKVCETGENRVNETRNGGELVHG